MLPLSTVSDDTASIRSRLQSQLPSQHLSSGTHPTIIEGYKKIKSIIAKELSSPHVADLEFILNEGAILLALQKPLSRGSITLNTTNPFSPPILNPRYLSNPIDTARLVEGIKFVRKMQATKA